MRSAPRLTPLITAIGVSLFLQNAGMLLFSPNPQRYPAILSEVRFEVFGVIVTNIKLTIFGVALCLMLGLHLFVQKTWTGRAMRALSFNIDAAKLMGIDTNRVIARPSPSAPRWPLRAASCSASTRSRSIR